MLPAMSEPSPSGDPPAAKVTQPLSSEMLDYSDISARHHGNLDQTAEGLAGAAELVSSTVPSPRLTKPSAAGKHFFAAELQRA